MEVREFSKSIEGKFEPDRWDMIFGNIVLQLNYIYRLRGDLFTGDNPSTSDFCFRGQHVKRQ